MCGIIGIIGKTNEKEIKSLLELVKYRGSSHNELLVLKNGGLGTNRLPIVDPENGKQPASNKSKTIFAVMNGEIFNYEELKKDLIEKGHSFQTNSDTELIPAIYEEYGTDFVEHIDSEMYSIIIYDKQNNSWIIARDQLGVKPLYYTQANGKTYFSSEAKQLSNLKDSLEINIFPPGNVYKDGKFINKTKFNNKPELEPTDLVIQKIRILFDKALKKRIPKDEKIGILLSGGIDSSAVLVTALKYSRDIIAFIVGTEKSSDKQFAVKLCEELGVEYKIINPKEPTIKDIEEVIKTVETDEKNTIKHSWVSYLACQEAKKHNLKILLCGEGADELFGGYDVFKNIPNNLNYQARKLLIEDLHLSQLPRVDRTGMKFTLEIRCPFLDKKLIDLALNLKTTNLKGETTKEVFREAMKDRLSKEFVNREKIPFSTGAGMPVDDKNNVFKKIINSIGEEEQEFINNSYNSLKYNKIIKKEAINKDNLLNILK